MSISFTASPSVPADSGLLVVGAHSDLSISGGGGAEVDQALAAACGFEAKSGQSMFQTSPEGAVLVVGLGDREAIDRDSMRKAGAAIARATSTVESLAVTAAGDDDLAGSLIEGIALGAYRYAAPKQNFVDHLLSQVTVVGASDQAVATAAVGAEATIRARDWINEPARSMTPSRLVEIAQAAASSFDGLEVEAWDRSRIVAEGLGGLEGVSAGAVEEPRLIKLTWTPSSPRRHVALVGKGITFDSGGLSLKTGAGMMTMKDDMGGAAAVMSATIAAAELGLDTAVTCWIAATENMPSGTAIHPGDVLTARNKKTIEVLNTDAEGRLVLADALSLAAEQGPDAIIDVATLTGAQVVALGHGIGAIWSTDDDLCDSLIEAGVKAGEPLWRMPLHAAYRKSIDSEVADMKNISGNPAAGSIIAAIFLQEFAGEGPWAHLDIAGPAWSDSADGWTSKGGAGFAARALLEYLSA